MQNKVDLWRRRGRYSQGDVHRRLLAGTVRSRNRDRSRIDAACKRDRVDRNSHSSRRGAGALADAEPGAADCRGKSRDERNRCAAGVDVDNLGRWRSGSRLIVEIDRSRTERNAVCRQHSEADGNRESIDSAGNGNCSAVSSWRKIRGRCGNRQGCGRCAGIGGDSEPGSAGCDGKRGVGAVCRGDLYRLRRGNSSAHRLRKDKRIGDSRQVRVAGDVKRYCKSLLRSIEIIERQGSSIGPHAGNKRRNCNNCNCRGRYPDARSNRQPVGWGCGRDGEVLTYPGKCHYLDGLALGWTTNRRLKENRRGSYAELIGAAGGAVIERDWYRR